jgi:hypothetical protein
MGGPAASTTAADAACHDLLVRLAGRLPDELLWRLRDWLAVGARPAVGGMLPRALLRGRVGLTDAERALLARAVDGWGGSTRLIDAVLPAPVLEDGVPRFRAAPEALDPAGLTLLGIVRGHPGCRGLARAWRLDGRREQAVMLVCGGDRPWVLTGVLQRVLRAHGDRNPCVEVLGADDHGPAPYHRAALAAATPLWRPDRAPVGV